MGNKREPKNIDRLEVPGLGTAEPEKRVKHATFGRGVIEELFEYPDGTNTMSFLTVATPALFTAGTTVTNIRPECSDRIDE